MIGIHDRALLVLLAIILAGCGADSTTTAATEGSIVDSAGVRVVTWPGPAPSDTVQPRLLWEHGNRTGDYQFIGIGFGVIREDGSALVVASGNRELVRIEGGGASHDVLARRGPGPSEVENPSYLLATTGADVWLMDGGNRKLLRFLGDSLVETVSAAAWDPERMRAGGVDSRGRLLVATGWPERRFEGPWFPGVLAAFDPTTSLVDTLGAFDFMPRSEGQPTSPFPHSGVVSVADGRFVAGRTDVPQLAWHAADGSVAQLFRWEQPLRYPTSDDWDAFQAWMFKLGLTEEMMSGWYAVDETQPLPLFGQVVGTGSGAVWVTPFMPGGPPATASEWRVAAPNGGWLGLAQFARPIRLLHVGADHIVAVHTDDFDVQSVAVYENPFGS